MEKSESIKEKSKNRIWEIDFIRGLAIILMVLDHLVYDFANFGVFFNDFRLATASEELYHFIRFCRNFYISDTRIILHQIFANLFFFLVGISCCFSKNNVKRGILVLGCGLVIDLITYIVFYVSDQSIDLRMIFNVLVIIGLCILITWLFMKIKYHKYICLGLGIAIIILGIVFNLYRANFVSEISWEDIPNILIGRTAFGSDCFSLIPYIGSVFVGVFVGETFYKDRKSLLPKLDLAFNKPLCFIGRKTIWVYCFHQVFILMIVITVGLSLGYHIF